MINKLRKRLIAAAMISLITVLIIIMGAINILNFNAAVAEADNTLTMLSENEGRFPMRDKNHKDIPGVPKFSPELPYESRFFWVLVSEDGTVISSDTSHIAAIDETEAKTLAIKVIKSDKLRGFKDNYRFLVTTESDGNRVIFLDCTRQLSLTAKFVISSVVISVSGIIAVFILMLLLSGKLVKPMSENYERQKLFITNAGHELKTPVTVIDADTEVLELETGKNEWTEDIRRQTLRLKTLTNDLIYLSRLEETAPDLLHIEFPISDVVSETAYSFKSVADTQNKHLSLSIEPMVSYTGDEKAISQLITILLDNAFKYSPVGSEITLSLYRKSKSICIEVTNSVLSPVDADGISRFFDRFYREESSRGISGYGIGLSIAKAITTAHKGKIAAYTPSQNTIKLTVILN